MKNKVLSVALAILVFSLCLAWSGFNVSGVTAEAAVRSAADLQKGEVIEGELDVIAECEETDGRTLYFVNTGKERLSVNFKSAPKEDLRTGMHVSISGSRGSGAEFVADEKPVGIRSGEAEASSLVAGEIKVLVFLVNFQNNPEQPYTAAQVNDLMFNEANGASVTRYYRESSYGQAWVTGDTVGWYTLPMDASTTACDQNSTIATLARNAATAAGINVSNYQKHMFIFPNMGCSYSGRGLIGGRDSWIDGSLILRTTAHELGHTLGLYHSKAMNCSSVISGTCTTTEYGHNADIIGQTGVTGHFHPYQKERLGWLNTAQTPAIITANGAGTYTISGLSVQDNNPKALKILKSGSAYYYVEFRRPSGFDSFVSSNSATMNGVLITQDSSDAENYMLDMVPSTTSWSDSALTVGRSFTDPTTNMTLTVVSVSSNGATVDITYGSSPCVMSAPTVSANPAATQWMMPGSTVSYTMTVTNNNTSNCSMNSFNIGASVPAGWNWVSASPTMNVAPGNSASAVVQLTAPSGTGAGAYSAALSAANSQSSAYMAVVNRDLAVYSSLDVSLVPSNPIYAVGATVVLTANVSANGAPVSGASVTFTITRPRTARRASAITGTAVTSANGTAVFSYRTNKKQDPIGIYSAAASVSSGGVTGSGATTFQVR